MLIVIAWTEVVQVWDGEPYRLCLGQQPRMVEQTQATACTWLLKGCDADVEKARTFVIGEYGSRGAVFTYPVKEKDPLGRAKKEILQ